MTTPTTASNLKTLLIAHPQPVSANDLNFNALSRMIVNDPPLARLVSGYRNRRGLYPTSPHYALTEYGVEVAARVCGEELPYLKDKTA